MLDADKRNKITCEISEISLQDFNRLAQLLYAETFLYIRPDVSLSAFLFFNPVTPSLLFLVQAVAFIFSFIVVVNWTLLQVCLLHLLDSIRMCRLHFLDSFSS